MKEAFEEVAVSCGSFPGIGLTGKFRVGIGGFEVYGAWTIKGKAPRTLKATSSQCKFSPASRRSPFYSREHSEVGVGLVRITRSIS